MPAVGSSSMRRRGRSASDIMISVARWSPCESAPTRISRLAVKSAQAQQARRRARRPRAARRAPSQGRRPIAGRDLDRDAKIVGDAELGKDLGDLECARHAPPRRALRATSARCPSSPSWIAPEVGAKKPLIRLKNVVLPAPFGPMIARNSPGSIASETPSTAIRLPKRLRDVVDLQQAHAAALPRSTPRIPRGKNRTTSTKTRPITDIQFSVWLET